MADEQQTETQEASPTASPWIGFRDSDWLLARMVHMANRDGLETGLTLTIGGSVIQGTLISGATYAGEMIEVVDKVQATGPEGDRIKEKLTDAFVEVMQVIERQNEETDDFKVKPPVFIHLRDAQWLYPAGEKLFSEGRCWRGRLDRIDGFALGASSPKRR